MGENISHLEILQLSLLQSASLLRLVLLQIQPSVVVVSSKTDDNMHRTLHSYGISGEQSEWGVVVL